MPKAISIFFLIFAHCFILFYNNSYHPNPPFCKNTNYISAVYLLLYAKNKALCSLLKFRDPLWGPRLNFLQIKPQMNSWCLYNQTQLNLDSHNHEHQNNPCSCNYEHNHKIKSTNSYYHEHNHKDEINVYTTTKLHKLLFTYPSTQP